MKTHGKGHVFSREIKKILDLVRVQKTWNIVHTSLPNIVF